MRLRQRNVHSDHVQAGVVLDRDGVGKEEEVLGGGGKAVSYSRCSRVSCRRSIKPWLLARFERRW